MKRRGLRFTLTAGAIGLAVVAGVVAFNWGVVRDHVEAWWFQLHLADGDGGTGLEGVLAALIRPYGVHGSFDSAGQILQYEHVYNPFSLLLALVRESGCPVIFASAQDLDPPNITLASQLQNVTTDTIRAVLQANGYRIIEQRFPRRAYVVVGYPESAPAPVIYSAWEPDVRD